MKFISNLFITFWTQLAVVVLTFGVSVIIARALGPEGKGAYSLIILVPSILFVFGNLGIGIANAYFSGKKKYEISNIASNSVVVALTLGIAMTIAFLVYFLIFQPSFLRDVQPKEALVLATMVLPFLLLTGYFNNMLLGLGKIKEFNLVILAQGAAFLPLVLFFLLVIKLNIFNVIIAWTIAALIASILSILLVTRVTKIHWSFHPSIFKESVKFGSQFYVGNLLQFLNYRLDMFIVAFFLSASFVGYYSVAVTFAETLWYFPAAVGTVIFAKTISTTPEEANKSTPIICRNTIILTVLAAILLFAAGKYIIIFFFGSAFLPALQPLQILLPGIIAFSVCKVLSYEIAARGKPIINTINVAISLAISIPLDIVLIPRIGISGAAWASTISYSASAIFSIVIFTKISGTNWIDLLIPKFEDLKFYRQAFSSIYRINFDRKHPRNHI